MNSLAAERQKRLQELAETDIVYQVWAQSFEEFRVAFVYFAGNQPEDVRNFLWGYADCGRMMQQRLVNLACENMVFPDEE